MNLDFFCVLLSSLFGKLGSLLSERGQDAVAYWSLDAFLRSRKRHKVPYDAKGSDDRV